MKYRTLLSITPVCILFSLMSCQQSGPDYSSKLGYSYSDSGQFYQVISCPEEATTVRIPSSYNDNTHGAHPVTEIGKAAFMNHTSLTMVVLPRTLKTIDSEAFSNCGFSSISIPSSVELIGSGAFSYCRKLESISFPAGTSLLDPRNGSWPCMGCTSLKSVSVGSESTLYSTDNGVIFDKNQEYLFGFPAGKTGNYVIPSTTLDITDFSFLNATLDSLVIPKSVTTISFLSFTDSAIGTFYCEASEKPSGWYDNWTHQANPKIVWGYSAK